MVYVRAWQTNHPPNACLDDFYNSEAYILNKTRSYEVHQLPGIALVGIWFPDLAGFHLGGGGGGGGGYYSTEQIVH